MNCSADGCSNCKKKNPNLSFFKLPSDPVISEIWKKNMGKISTKFKQVRLCSAHFEDKYFDYSHYLKIRLLPTSNFLVKHKLVPGAIPTIFGHGKIEHRTYRKPFTSHDGNLQNVETNNIDNKKPAINILSNTNESKNTNVPMIRTTIDAESSTSNVYIILSPTQSEEKYSSYRICPFYKSGLLYRNKNKTQDKCLQTDFVSDITNSESRKRKRSCDAFCQNGDEVNVYDADTNEILYHQGSEIVKIENIA